MHEAGEVVIRFDREAKEGGGTYTAIQQDFNLSDVSLEIILHPKVFLS